jgi:hypothetical protein
MRRRKQEQQIMKIAENMSKTNRITILRYIDTIAHLSIREQADGSRIMMSKLSDEHILRIEKMVKEMIENE